MKKILLALLAIGMLIMLASCAKEGDVVKYITSQGYAIIDRTDTNLILSKDGLVYWTKNADILISTVKNIPRNFVIHPLPSVVEKGIFNLNLK